MHFRRSSLGIVYGFLKTIFARDTSKKGLVLDVADCVLGTERKVTEAKLVREHGPHQIIRQLERKPLSVARLKKMLPRLEAPRLTRNQIHRRPKIA